MSKQQKQQPANRPIEIEINGEKYPYIETMGAMVGFKQETGLTPCAWRVQKNAR